METFCKIAVIVGSWHRIIKVSRAVSCNSTLQNLTEEEEEGGRLGRHRARQAGAGTGASGSPGLPPMSVQSTICRLTLHHCQSVSLPSLHSPFCSGHTCCVCR